MRWQSQASPVNCLRRVSMTLDMGLSGMLASSRIQRCLSASLAVMRFFGSRSSSLQAAVMQAEFHCRSCDESQDLVKHNQATHASRSGEMPEMMARLFSCLPDQGSESHTVQHAPVQPILAAWRDGRQGPIVHNEAQRTERFSPGSTQHVARRPS